MEGISLLFIVINALKYFLTVCGFKAAMLESATNFGDFYGRRMIDVLTANDLSHSKNLLLTM